MLSAGGPGGCGLIHLNSEYFSVLAAHSGLASTAAELDPLDASSLLLSLPCLKRTPTAASQLLHSVKQLSNSSQTALLWPELGLFFF